MTVSINGTNGLTFNDNSTQATAATGFGFKNRIINGDMRIDQRNAGAASANTINNYFLDRWYVQQNVTGKLIAQQNQGSVTPPAGFTHYLGVTSQSAYTVGASETFAILQPIEGFNVADLAFGTANASAVTLSFRVYSSLTGTFGGSLQNSAVNRSYPFTYTIASANTWTTVSITIPGDTTGTWLTNSGVGLYITFGLGAGSTRSGTAGAWAGARYDSATGATSVVGTTGATFYITGVQLEKGSTATSFDYRDYGRELAMCQRYYYQYSGDFRLPLVRNDTPVRQNTFNTKVTMRTAPTVANITASGTTTLLASDVDSVCLTSSAGTLTSSISVSAFTASSEL